MRRRVYATLKRAWAASWLLAGLALPNGGCGWRRERSPEVQRSDEGSSTPALRLVLVGDLQGALEPCGCTSRKLGGIDRLVSAVRAARAEATASAVVLGGDVFFAARPGAAQLPMQDFYHAETLATILRNLRPEVVAVGAEDLARGGAMLSKLGRAAGVPLLRAGFVPTDDAPTTPAAAGQLVTSRLLQIGGVHLGVISVMGKPPVAGFASDVGVPVDRAMEAQPQITALEQEGATLVLVVVQGDAQLADTLARRTAPGVLVMETGAASQQELGARKVGASTVLRVGRGGEGVLIVDVWPPKQPRRLDEHAAHPASGAPGELRARYVTIDGSVAPDLAVHAMLGSLWQRINAWNARDDAEPEPPARGAPGYIGSRTCAACHTREYFWWTQSPHGRAYATLVARQRQLDRDCIGCHVTGYGRPGGSTLTHLGELEGAGCESCHGPGSSHTDNPRSPRRDVQRSVAESVCHGCHDPEHSDRFRYASAHQALLATGHGAPVTFKSPAASGVE